MMEQIEKRIYNLSVDNSSGKIQNGNYKSIIDYTIPNIGLNEPNILYADVSVQDAIIPCSFYNIDVMNNFLDISFNSTITRVSIPIGNYNALTFQQTFLPLLGNGWNLVYHHISGKYTISYYDEFTLLSSGLSSILGFENKIDAIDDGNNYTITFPNVANFYPIPRIIIRCNKFSTTQQLTNTSSMCCQCDVLATIPNDQPMNGKICYKNITQIKNSIYSHDLQQFQITLSDDFNNPINFNGVSCQFQLMFEIHRLVPTIPKLTFNDIYNYSSQEKEDSP